MALKLLLDNVFDRAALSADPALVATLPEANLQRSRRDAVARTTGLATQHILGDLAAPAWIDTAALWGHRLTTGGVWRVRLYSGPGQTGTLEYDSGDMSAVALKTLGELIWGIDPLNIAWSVTGSTPHDVLWMDTAVRAASFDIEWTDTANPAGFTQVGRIYLGLAFSPEVNFDWGATLHTVDDSSYLRSAAGSLFVDRASRYRELSLTLSWLSRAEITRLLDETAARGKEGDVLVCAYPDAPPGQRMQYTLAARWSELPQATSRFVNTHATTLTFIEI